MGLHTEENIRKKAFIAIFTVIILSVWFWGSTAQAVTTSYVFVTDESTVVISTSGWPQGTVFIDGQFQLTVDFDAGIASFDNVNATLGDAISYYEEGEFFSTESLDVLFRMTQLESTNVSDTQIDFLFERNIPTFPGADIHLTATFVDDSLEMVGYFCEPLVDGLCYELDAVAVPEPGMLLLFALGTVMLRKRK